MSDTASYRVLVGDALEQLRTLPDRSVHCVVSSPPYWGLRDYGTGRWEGGDPECDHQVRAWDGPKQTQGAQSGHAAKHDRLDRPTCMCGAARVDLQLGLEPTPEAYVGRLVTVFREVRRVLRDDGTFWLNLGDSYAGSWGAMSYAGGDIGARRFGGDGQKIARPVTSRLAGALKPKDLVGIPWRVAFALQADGWWLRSDIVWAKPNPMPESVTDRPTRSHEYVFLLTKAERYYYDAAAIREPAVAVNDHDATGPGYQAPGQTTQRGNRRDKQRGHGRRHAGFNERWDAMSKAEQQANGRNKRDVWTIATQPYPDAHFATFPEALVEPMILAGCPVGGTVLDPFAGSGTTLAVANRLGRHAIGIELNPGYVKLIEQRCAQQSWVLKGRGVQ